ncbi:DUF308 domain-containing protein [Xanthomarina sp. F1114]|uniref:HdeD family acid-resistance protein n=1 Tax=Xanthomarina sp. F1114 TaxID=2996019 RepID=UPI00225E61D6|nr:DUF308 domain-containing protein [Xanthomarina sp. F1114]MCX7548622.1 DUF308 domain-containing protein [Xanthomarina sp. F1114]
MRNQFIKTVQTSIKHWYLPLIIGVIFIALGIYSIMSPQVSFAALTIFFSLSFLFSGMSEVIFSISNKDEIENWGWSLALGIMTALIGLLLIMNPDISALTLALYIGFIVLFRSIGAISYSIDLRSYGITDWGFLLTLGVLGVIFSFILLWNPAFAGMTAVIWVGMALIILGLFNAMLSLKLKKLKDFPNKISSELKQRLRQIQSEIEDQINS